MSRGNAFRLGRLCALTAAFAVVGARSWAGEKIEVSGATVVLPSTLSTNKPAKTDEPSPDILRFENRINDMESRFGWQGNLPGNRPSVGVMPIPMPAPSRQSPSKNDKKNQDWLSAPAGDALDYEAALGATMFSKPKESATSSATSGAASGTPNPDSLREADRFEASKMAADPFTAQLQEFIRPDAIFNGATPGVDGQISAFGASRPSAFSPAPTALSGFNDILPPERTLDGILGRTETTPLSTVPTLNSVLSGGTVLATDPRRFETGVDAVLRSSRPPEVADPVIKPPTPSFSSIAGAPTLDDILSSSSTRLDATDSDRRPKSDVTTSRGYLDPRNRPPAVLPGPGKSFFGGF